MEGTKNCTLTHTHYTPARNPYGLPLPVHITSRGGTWVTGSSGPGHGVATCGTVGNITDGGTGVGGFTSGTMVVGWLGADEKNGPNNKCVDGVCPRPHADFLLASLAFFRSVLSVSTNSLSLSMFSYFEWLGFGSLVPLPLSLLVTSLYSVGKMWYRNSAVVLSFFLNQLKTASSLNCLLRIIYLWWSTSKSVVHSLHLSLVLLGFWSGLLNPWFEETLSTVVSIQDPRNS